MLPVAVGGYLGYTVLCITCCQLCAVRHLRQTNLSQAYVAWHLTVSALHYIWLTAGAPDVPYLISGYCLLTMFGAECDACC